MSNPFEESFKASHSISDEELREEQRSLTGGDPEVEKFLADQREKYLLAADMTEIQLHDIGITGKNILTLYEIADRSDDQFSTLVAAARNPQSTSLAATDLLEAIDRVERGEPHGLDIKKIVREFDEE